MRNVLIIAVLALASCQERPPEIPQISQPQSQTQTQAASIPPIRRSSYAIHKDITTTYFWVGEAAASDGTSMANTASAWDEQWVTHFGGVDDPKHRIGYRPAKFVPKENAFYFALPYGDNGRHASALQVVPWAGQKQWHANESLCKNRWIKISKAGKDCYAQWEDVGPFQEHDAAYVFGDGTQRPKNKSNQNAGLDVSPAVHDYLGLRSTDKVDWQFVDDQDVPDGPWKKTITGAKVR